MSETAIYRVVVDGTDISRALAPILISLKVSLHAEKSSDTATIEIDDTNGRIRFPRDGASMSVELGWQHSGTALVFMGTVDDVKSRGARGAGRTITITARSAETKGKGKEHQDRHWDDKSLKEVLEDAAKAAGITVKVDPKLGAIKREWWGMNAESFYHFGTRLSREVGGAFKVFGKTAVFAARNAGLSMSGAALSIVTARWGDNLINWDIAPVTGRPRFKAVEARWFDRKEAKWKREKVEIDDPSAVASAITRFVRKDKDEAKAAATNDKSDSEREKGEGSVLIDGNVAATPEGTCIVIGARPGVDGSYRIDTVDHELSRSNGFTTSLSLKQPSGDAGKDSRGSAGG
ncbi:contractile injection system protein, VgrG/Pvc8 family [Rhodoplanes sp. TEM]|uniref:Contractile injection system protein, VgrG/Pvc8 family n=1 Tax=Rhodoplanes tepidamans TaxID=200616 RepID=A0ABT5J540_RHOTP|nr:MULTISPECIES: contractile injection system protein, VgrG/Pvc8 family [Rhodoplanes]MDC7784750.1 contractile injection system protein, VgrG/Pvc8 family [Rhodoplanes tepidamans]MDC7982217.1 contractile injection system protein, VgrG/Pvc8 family [Rhodoplanes sp. TEM]MDQ0356223.1 phage protein D [Rhodoplanes tepidamans]